MQEAVALDIPVDLETVIAAGLQAGMTLVVLAVPHLRLVAARDFPIDAIGRAGFHVGRVAEAGVGACGGRALVPPDIGCGAIGRRGAAGYRLRLGRGRRLQHCQACSQNGRPVCHFMLLFRSSV